MYFVSIQTVVVESRKERAEVDGGRVIVGGLEELAYATLGGAVGTVLRQSSAMGKPPLILFCREADWPGAADQARIEDDQHAR